MQCDCGKKFLAAAAVFAFKVISGAALCGGIFNWVYSLAPTCVWQPMEPGWKMYTGMFLMAALFVLGYKLVSKAFDGMGVVQKGALYGVCIWLAGVMPGMICTYVFMTVNTTVVVYWALSSLVLTPIEGIIVAFFLRDSSQCCSSGKSA